MTAQIRSAAGRAVAPTSDGNGVVALCNDYAGIQSDRSPSASTPGRRAIVAGAHLPFPGAGRIRRAGDGFRYEPLELPGGDRRSRLSQGSST